MNLLNMFDLTLIERKNETALEFNGASYTFGDIEDRSNRTAATL